MKNFYLVVSITLLILITSGVAFIKSTKLSLTLWPANQEEKIINDSNRLISPSSSPTLDDIEKDTQASNEATQFISDKKERWIEVSIKNQLLTAWEGEDKFMEIKISSGKWNSTPRGTFYIWHKSRLQKMSGGSKENGTYYYVPNVPNSMFFLGDFAIHGAYWHNNFGHPMSNGCINVPVPESAKLFDWANPIISSDQKFIRSSKENPGTKVIIQD